MPVTVEKLVFLSRMAQKDLGAGRWTDLAADLQDYLVLRRILNKERVGFQSGTSIQGNVMTDDNGSAQMVGLYGIDTYEDVDGWEKFDVPWRHAKASWSYDVRTVKMASGKARILNLVKAKKAQAMLSLAKKLEAQFWTKPADSSDELNMFGLPYWIVKNAVLGFNGGNPAGFTAGAGSLDSTVFPNWKNHTGSYVNWTKDDCVRKMRTTYENVQFKCPYDCPDYRRGSERYEIFMGLTTRQMLEEIGEKQNDNLGRDIAPMDGRIVFNGNPVTRVPYLDSDTSYPIFFVDWSRFYFVFLQGEYLREEPAEKAPNQSTVVKADIYLTANLRCTDRRRLGVLYKAAA